MNIDCTKCLFESKNTCVWHEKSIDRVPLCGGVHFIDKEAGTFRYCATEGWVPVETNDECAN